MSQVRTAVTEYPRFKASFNIAEPTKPLAPIKTMFSIVFFDLLLSCKTKIKQNEKGGVKVSLKKQVYGNLLKKA